MPEPEVAAHQDCLRAHRVQQITADKILGSDIREVPIEARDQRGVNSGGANRGEALIEGFEKGRRFRRPQDPGGVGIKRKHRGQRVGPAGSIEDRMQNLLMAKVDAVEIANRNDRAPARVAEPRDPLFGRMYDG
jgi:hypothetical protein